MPKIQWTGLPEGIRTHLFLRLKERKISEEDLYKLKLWRESEPEAPDGPWYKDFGLQDLWRGTVSEDVPLEGTGCNRRGAVDSAMAA